VSSMGNNMPRKRIIATLVVKHGIVVQSIGFQKYLPIGKPEIAARFLDQWGVDEIVLLDIDARLNGNLIDPVLVKRVSGSIFVPLTVGGGIQTLDDIQNLLKAGADKVSINGIARQGMDFYKQAADIFGTQCIIGAIDARRSGDGPYAAYTHNGKIDLNLTPGELASDMHQHGVGEVFLNSIDNDGAGEGFDMDLINSINDSLSIPLIISGGAGKPTHLSEALRHPKVEAVAAANFFHFTEHSIATIKSVLSDEGIYVRTDCEAAYTAINVDTSGRLQKKPDADLLDMYFEFVEEEKI